MVKRRPTQNSELRATSVNMSVHRYADIAGLQAAGAQHWGVRHIQPFFPSIEKLFKTDETAVPIEHGVHFETEMAGIVSADSVRTADGRVLPVHRKVAMILSPVKLMRGNYGSVLGLPATLEQATALHQKMQNPNNAAFVGSIISAAVSESGCQHFPRVYGVFSGIAAEHRVDISDEYEDLHERQWFSANIGKTFAVDVSESVQASPEFGFTRKARTHLALGGDALLDGVVEMETEPVECAPAEMVSVFNEGAGASDDGESDSSSVSTSYVFGVRSCDCSMDGSETDDTSDASPEPFAWATFRDVPVQITVMEPCDGTIYALMMAHPETEKHHAWIAQVVFALAFAQRNFAFVHNDLHGNNVMYVKTDREFLYYSVGGDYFRVPTHGYLIKLIDFERSNASIKVAGMKAHKTFMSDHYAVDEEAGGQYNCEPYYVAKYDTVKPNPSFDLARLATSLFWDLFPEGAMGDSYKDNALFHMFLRWMGTGDGHSVLFGKEDEAHDRFHGFHLHKAIAKFCKDAVPRKEIAHLKGAFGVPSVPLGERVCSIDA
jgi:hypothetical protein